MGLFKEYIIYTHHDSSLQTIGQFLSNLGLSIVRGMTASELLNYEIEGNDGQFISNFKRVSDQYNAFDRETFLINGEPTPSRPLDTFPIYIGTRLAIPKSQLFSEVALISGYDQTEPITAVDTFLAENHARLLSDPNYYPIDKTDLKNGKGILATQYPNLSVWMWCRALSPEDADYISVQSRNTSPDFLPGGKVESQAETRRRLVKHFGIDGNLIDITPFVISLQTQIDAGGGSFSLSLAPIEGERDKSIGWRPSTKTMNAITAHEFVAQAKINKYDNDLEITKRTKFLFHNAIQPNDVIFIRFETLELESDRRDLEDEYSYIIDKNRLAGRVYDMIGLVDANMISTRSVNEVEVTIDVQGRDLMKLLQEDGSYFYPLAYTNYKEGEYGDQKLLRRLTVTGKYPLFGEYAYRSIQYSSEFIINQVSNISITPDNLFTSYGDRVSKTLQFDSASAETLKTILTDLKETIEYEIGLSRRVDKIALSDAALERAVIVQGFNEMKLFMTDAYDQKAWLYDRATFKATGWKGGTYGGQTVSKFRNPARWGQDFIYSSSKSTLGETNRSITDAQGNNEDFVDKLFIVNSAASDAINDMFRYIQLEKGTTATHEPLPMPGIWQIIKLAFDPQLDALRISDPSISQPDGPLMNQMKKICQEPFVEFYGDTYGDLYYFMFRRPPWNKSAILRFLSDYNLLPSYSTPTVLQAQRNDRTISDSVEIEVPGVNVESRTPFVIDIFEEDVINDNLTFYDGEVYSLYEIVPQAGFLGQGSEVSTGYIPIIQIPEYGEIYGTKILRVVNQYTRFDGSWRLKELEKINVIEQAGKDLEWLVETNMYLPFTRQGRITINGDRRIKRGTWIRFNPTGEIFYVTSVSQEYSISSTVERVTTLVVERGMEEKFIEGATVVDADGVEFFAGYFEIAKTERIASYVSTFIKNYAKAGSIMKTFVNERVLNFFLKRNQLKDNITTEESDSQY